MTAAIMADMDEAFVLQEALFDALKHPRDRTGRWRETLGSPHAPRELKKLAAKLEPREIQRKERPFEQTETYRRARRRFAYTRETGVHGDEMMYDLATDQGFAGRPHKVTVDELEAEIEAGGVEAWRGTSDREYADKFTGGTYYAGQGFRGNGIYIATDGGAKTRARQYAVAPTTRGITSKTERPTVMRIALHRDAKIGDYDQVAAAAKEAHLKFGAVKYDPGDGGQVPGEAIMAEVARDPGRWAILNGWDALRINEHEVLVLNRTALLVSEEFEDAGEHITRAARSAA